MWVRIENWTDFRQEGEYCFTLSSHAKPWTHMQKPLLMQKSAPRAAIRIQELMQVLEFIKVKGMPVTAALQ